MRRQLYPAITFPDIKDPAIAKAIRLLYETQAKAYQDLQDEFDKDPRFSDVRVTNALRGMANNIHYVDNPAARTGDIATLLDDGKNFTFASQTNAGPGGVTPSAGFPHPLLDGDQNNDTVAQTPTRGSLIYANSTPAWDELVKPGSASRLNNNATDAAWIAEHSGRDYLPHTRFADISGTPLAKTIVGTAPDAYEAWAMTTASGGDILAYWQVPEDYKAGTAITFKVDWTTTAPAAQNWVPDLNYIAVADNSGINAASTNVTAGATSANITANTRKRTAFPTVSTFAAGDWTKLIVRRTLPAGDTFTATILILGLRVEYTTKYQ